MKRALAVCTVLAVLGFGAFGIGTFSGKWETKIILLPASNLGLDYTTLTINYSDFGWTFTSISKFDSTGFVYEKLGFTGPVGPITIKGNMWFDPTAPAYEAADLTTSLDFAGVTFGLTVRHWAASYAGNFFSNSDSTKPWYPDTVPCSGTYSNGLQYIITAKVSPLSLKVRFVDCCSGTTLQDLSVTLSGLGLCCGITYDASLYFTKAGFQYVQFTAYNVIQLCCGISFDVRVRFGTSYKYVYIKPKFAGFGEACFTVYGDADFGGLTGGTWNQVGGNAIEWAGIKIYGWAIECKIADCNSLKIVTALDPAWYNDNVEDVFKQNEFEYVKLSFCGAGCCGGQYTVGLSVFFQQSGSLFGITRIGADMSIPVMSNLTVNVSFDSSVSLKVGWTFTF